MTAHSLATIANQGPETHGFRLAKISRQPQPFEVPPAICSTLWLNSECSGYEYNALAALSRAKHDGCLDAISPLACRALAALSPIDGQKLLDRLTLLGMSMANGRDAEQVKAWLHETVRLLEDLPGSVLFPAIDECVQEPGRVFVPSVGEIRAKAVPAFQKLQRQAARLNRLKQLLEEGVEIPDHRPPQSVWCERAKPAEPEEVCSPEDAAAILKEFGFTSDYGPGAKLAEMLRAGETKSPQQLAENGQEMPRPRAPQSDDWSFMP